MILDEIKSISTHKKDLRNFGITIGIILLIITAIIFYKSEKVIELLFYSGVFLIGFGLVFPKILKPLYLIWMTFAVIIGWVMTRIILSILFYIIITPIGLITRILGRNNFHSKNKGLNNTFWNYRKLEKDELNKYENQY